VCPRRRGLAHADTADLTREQGVLGGARDDLRRVVDEDRSARRTLADRVVPSAHVIAGAEDQNAVVDRRVLISRA
jgi:hypothetical protein